MEPVLAVAECVKNGDSAWLLCVSLHVDIAFIRNHFHPNKSILLLYAAGRQETQKTLPSIRSPTSFFHSVKHIRQRGYQSFWARGCFYGALSHALQKQDAFRDGS